ncbi:hypothetical protein FSP39_002450 [Pinctada imbricata]|uniref:Ankyrin repeat protein n=1 Tax=Pinctada imbricata TaxID=66713 RepID=A0AA89C4X2_PINIB|nr:hypothetical protein FSP39_002450 [Pinctada imbricata]
MEQAFVSTDPKMKSLADEAREIVENHGKHHVTKDGNTLMHLYVRKPKVFLYVFASRGVPVNIQNEKRDTALHIAVREGILSSAEALLQCSADLTIRNAMGMTPMDEADPKDKAMKAMLDTFKEGKTLLQLAETRGQTEKGSVQNCVRLLREFRSTSQLIHAVLCEDVEEIKRILMYEKGWSVNYRFRDKMGKTLLSSAVESNNLDIVMLLVEHGARFRAVRVREDERVRFILIKVIDDKIGQSDVTVPLFQKAINPDLNPEIAKYLNSKLTDTSEHMEKDVNGNTPVLRAIESGCPAKFIHWLLTVTNGRCLTDRNKDSLTTKELAQARNREDVVKTIDRFILAKMIPTRIPQFSTHFWKEKDLCPINDEVAGKNLEDIINKEDKYDVRKWINFHDVHNHAIRLFEAVALGNEDIVEKNYDANYKDRNGYTALIRGIVYQQYQVCKYLCMTRPNLKSDPDNWNRYPLHYAYALPDGISHIFIKLLLEGDPDIEHKVDKDGRCPAEYGDLKVSTEIQRMLYDARTLDVYGKRGPPLGPWPKGALTRPPDENQPMEFLEVL